MSSSFLASQSDFGDSCFLDSKPKIFSIVQVSFFEVSEGNIYKIKQFRVVDKFQQ